MKKQKGKSRLKATRNKKRIKKALVIGAIIDCLLWTGVFYSIKQLNKNDFQLATIQKTIIKEVKAKEPLFTPSQKTIKIINSNVGISGQIAEFFGDDWTKYAELIARESSFNPQAINTTSGACGLAQALPCSKMACDLDDIECQLKWIKKYVLARYGSIEKALLFHDLNNYY
jgi:hypothetical protein